MYLWNLYNVLVTYSLKQQKHTPCAWVGMLVKLGQFCTGPSQKAKLKSHLGL